MKTVKKNEKSENQIIYLLFIELNYNYYRIFKRKKK